MANWFTRLFGVVGTKEFHEKTKDASKERDELKSDIGTIRHITTGLTRELPENFKLLNKSLIDISKRLEAMAGDLQEVRETANDAIDIAEELEERNMLDPQVDNDSDAINRILTTQQAFLQEFVNHNQRIGAVEIQIAECCEEAEEVEVLEKCDRCTDKLGRTIKHRKAEP